MKEIKEIKEIKENNETAVFLLEGCAVHQIYDEMPDKEQNFKEWYEYYGSMLLEFAKKHSSGTIIISEPRYFDNIDEKARLKFIGNLKNKLNNQKINIKIINPMTETVDYIHEQIKNASHFYNRNFAVFYNWSSEAQFRSEKETLYKNRIDHNTDVSMFLGLKVKIGNLCKDLYFMEPQSNKVPILWQDRKDNSLPQLPLKKIEDYQNYRNLVNIVSQLNAFTLRNNPKDPWYYNTAEINTENSIEKLGKKNPKKIEEWQVISLLEQLSAALDKFYQLEQKNSILEMYINNNMEFYINGKSCAKNLIEHILNKDNNVENMKPINPFFLDSTAKIKLQLEEYIRKVENGNPEKINFQAGFWIAKSSQGKSREANYNLAKKLLDNLNKTKNITDVFSSKEDINNLRISTLGKDKFKKLSFFGQSKIRGGLREILKYAEKETHQKLL